MVPEIRKHFNETFTKEKYQAYLADLNSKHPEAVKLREEAETTRRKLAGAQPMK